MIGGRRGPDGPRADVVFVAADARALDYYGNVVRALGTASAVIVIDDVTRRLRALPETDLPVLRLSRLLRAGRQFPVAVGQGKVVIPVRRLPRLLRAAHRSDRDAGPHAPRNLLVDAVAAAYAATVGRALVLTRLDRPLRRLTGRSWTGRSARARWLAGHGSVTAEVLLGDRRVFFPHGVDMKPRPAPDRPRPTHWDLMLCHGPFDAEYRAARFAAPVATIGYPRYDHLGPPSDAAPFAPVARAGGRRLAVLWLPTVHTGGPPARHPVRRWLPIVRGILDVTDVTVRPHPKDVAGAPELIAELGEAGFTLDLDGGRDLGAAIRSADVVLCDYGGTVFSVVYLDQPLVLLEHREGGEHDLPALHALRRDLVRLQVDDGSRPDLLRLLVDEPTWRDQVAVRRRIRTQLFGPDPHGGAGRTAAILRDLVAGRALPSTAGLPGGSR